MFGFIGKSLDLHALNRNQWKGGMGVAVVDRGKTKETRYREH
jgi:hypothetical protein